MKLILIAACFAVCQAAKLNRGYLPPESAKTAGGNGDILQTPFISQGSAGKSLPTNIPAGGYVNEFEGVVIDADAAGTRATHSGLGNSRETYGSTDSKVGAAAFRETNLNANRQDRVTTSGNKVQETASPVAGHVNVLPNVAGVRQPLLQSGGNQIPVLEAERFHAARDRTSNIIAYQNDIGITDFNYAFHTDNGISAAEVGVVLDGVRSKGGYSYTGDDGQVYTISYTADEDGYKPQGSHIPTPPPIPPEILKALEQNAKDEAAGIVDDGSYDAKKYNTDRTKGNRPNDYNDKDEHNTFEKRPVFNVISAINQNSQANKPNRDEDNRNNGQNQFPNVNLGYTVNDKQISNFSNIRNQYENKFDIITNNKYNNNGPISNFKELDKVTQSIKYNNNENQSQNVPLSQQKLQDKNEVPDSLSGKPNSYQAPIAAIQNQQLNNDSAFQKQTQAQLRPTTYQSSINGAIGKQQTIEKPENSFVNSNYQSRPNSYEIQTTGLVQQQNSNKKGAIFQTQFQNNFESNQQSFSSGAILTQSNPNRQQAITVNIPNNNLLSHTFNKANDFSKPTITPTRLSSHEATTGTIQNLKPIANVRNIFFDPTQNRPTSYGSLITGTIQNQQPIANINNIYFNPITTQKRPTSYDVSTTGNFQTQQSIANSDNAFSFNPFTTQTRPSSYDAQTIQKQQPNLGNVIFNPTITQAKPTSDDASISGTIQNQQLSINSENTLFKPTTAQPRPTLNTSYEESTTVDTSLPQQDTTQAKPGSQSQQINLGFYSGFPNAGQSDVRNEGELYEYPKPDKNLENVASVTTNQIPILNPSNSLSNPSKFQSRPNSYDTFFTGTLQKPQLPFPNSAKVNKYNINQNQITLSQGVTSAHIINTNSQPVTQNNNFNSHSESSSIPNQDSTFFKPSPVETNSYDVSNTRVSQQQQSHYNLVNGNSIVNNLNTKQHNQGNLNLGVTIPQFLNANSQQINKDSNSASSNLPSQEITSHNKDFDNQFNTETKPNSQDITSVEEIQPQQPFNIISTINQFQNKENKNQQNFNLSVTSSQFPNINSQLPTEDNNNAHNSDSVSQFSSHISASSNSESPFEQSSQNFDSTHPTSSSFTFNGENVDNNFNKGQVDISSLQNHNDDFQSNYLHKKFSLRRQQQINQQAFLNFLHSKNVANAPVLISSNYNNQPAQPAFEFSNFNSNDGNQGQTLQLFSSSQKNQPYPTPQSFAVTGPDTNLFTAAPSRTLSTPKDTNEVIQGTSGITQASISPFPSLAPSTSKESGNIFNPISQTSNLPIQAIGSSLGVNSVEIQSQQVNSGISFGFGNKGSEVITQSQDEIYEYPKPDQNLPVPTKSSENLSQTNFKLTSAFNNNGPIEVRNSTVNKIFPTSSTTIDNTKTESGIGVNRLPSRPQFISNSCCSASLHNVDKNQSTANTDSTDVNSESKTSTFHSAKEEFEGPKTQQTYDETGYHY